MIKTDISHYKYNMYYARIKRVYKYSEARLVMQSLSPLDVVGLGGMQGGTSIQTYHTRYKYMGTKQQSNLCTSILRLDLCYKACSPRICWALELDKEEHRYKHIILGTNIICTKQQSNMFTSNLRLDWECKACSP